MNETLVLILAISGMLVGLCAAGIVVVVVGAMIWHYAPNSRAGRWISDEVIQTVDVSDIKIGGCISPKTHMLGDNHGSL